MKFSLLILLILLPAMSQAQQNVSGCLIFPSNNVWNTPKDYLPVHPKSADYINTIGSNLSLRNDFGSGLWNGNPIGIPFVAVGANQERVIVNFEYSDESDNTAYPIPPDAPIEGGSDSDGDRHILIIDSSDCKLYEIYRAYPNQDGSWEAGSGAIFDLNSNALRTDSWTSADAAGLPIFPGLASFEEVAKGEIRHMLRFTVPKTQRKYLWPARHYASSITDDNYPPMGLVLRLKSDFDILSLAPQARIIAKALQTYGMILADNGSPWFISGIPNENWDMDDLYTLRQIKGNDFEAIDISSLMIDTNSAEAKQPLNNISDEHDNDNFYFSNDNIVSISLAKDDKYSIYDLTGSIIQSAKLNAGRHNLDVSHLTKGFYFIRIGMISRKLLIQ